ncbi:MAG: PadR family transcriptional regulator [Candidatus Thorarchaeota archaeon]|nr:PadR family transcriptional regulator [Candidatus Thorarchaeota archaeon]
MKILRPEEFADAVSSNTIIYVVNDIVKYVSNDISELKELAQKQMKKWVKHTARVPRGFLRFQFMRLLKEGPMSGSELADQIEQETDGEYRPGSGSIYPVLKKLRRSGFIEKLPIEEGVQRYRLTERGGSFFEENRDVMEQVRERLDAVDSHFLALFHVNPKFRDYFMRISSMMMSISDLSKRNWTSELNLRIERILKTTAEGLEDILRDFQTRRT